MSLPFVDDSCSLTPRSDRNSFTSSRNSSIVALSRAYKNAISPLARAESRPPILATHEEKISETSTCDDAQVSNTNSSDDLEGSANNESFRNRLRVLGKSIQATGIAGKLFLQNSSSSMLPDQFRKAKSSEFLSTSDSK
ncbi:hypothetical protein Ciccas_009470 [Cichlidogyrus casuarinus]|uniref:Uncharacterized protein n=1 Tax=Cichlidogyrus casuarinus TaxID=1844966 RepID=A0ABD2PXX1_9PLAT